MQTINLSQLITKLDSATHKKLEKAVAKACALRHASADIQHLLSILITEECGFNQLLVKNSINSNQLKIKVEKYLCSLPKSLIDTPALSANIVEWLKEAWMHTSMRTSLQSITSSDLLLALISSPYLQQISAPFIPEISKLSQEKIMQQVADLNIHSENQTINQEKPEYLKQYTINLNQKAKQGELSIAQGREHEIQQMINILQRKKQNNPILIGEPGVGKTALVEGLAYKIVNNQVPDIIRQVEIVSLDMGLLMAGASIKGEFEKRLKGIINEIKAQSKTIILFIDEAHTLIGTGNQAGGLDSANLLKPALARGELKTIAATTLSEYKLYLEKDAAFTRRFQSIYIKEPTDAQALIMLRAIQPSLEQHHKVYIQDESLITAIRLSRRYIADRFLPDKAISLLDTACAYNALQRQTEPYALSKKRNHLKVLETELLQMTKNILLNNDQSKLNDIKNDMQLTKKAIKKIQAEYAQEKKIIDQLDKLMQTKKKNKHSHNLFNKKLKSLEDLHKQHSHIQYSINSKSIETIVTDWTGIPLNRITANTSDKIKQLKQHLKQNVIGQNHATEMIMHSMSQQLLKINDPDKPLGVFLFTGPSGVGKTHTAKIIAELFFGSAEHMTTLNMSEFKESHKVSMLLGSPPGYVGYGEGGVLTEPVRRQPYHLILLDEIEKAHDSIHEVFYQIFDQGLAKDSQGREINFKNTIFIMTCNIGSELCSSIENCKADTIKNTLQSLLLNHFKPAFLGRIKTIPFTAITAASAEMIISRKLDIIIKRIIDNHDIGIDFDTKTVESILSNSDYELTGARDFDKIIEKSILPKITDKLLAQQCKI
jgi:type VI secretion system protein VasG